MRARAKFAFLLTYSPSPLHPPSPSRLFTKDRLLMRLFLKSRSAALSPIKALTETWWGVQLWQQSDFSRENLKTGHWGQGGKLEYLRLSFGKVSPHILRFIANPWLIPCHLVIRYTSTPKVRCYRLIRVWTVWNKLFHSKQQLKTKGFTFLVVWNILVENW